MKNGFKQKNETRTCRKCGTKMRQIDGTNVFVCEGLNKNGNPCGQYSIKRIFGFNGEGSPCYMPRKKANKEEQNKPS